MIFMKERENDFCTDIDNGLMSVCRYTLLMVVESTNLEETC